MTKEQKKIVRKALRLHGRGLMEVCPAEWEQAICWTLDYYAREDPVCGELLRLRYLERKPEGKVIELLHVGRTTYYHKELEALSTLSTYAAGLGLL